jgi:putative GTP pyrophosphokinase
MATSNCQIKLNSEKIICEIQVRTKLMDVWADLTHEFHYKSKLVGIEDQHLEKVLASQANRFYSEDESFIAIRDLYQKIFTGG